MNTSKFTARPAGAVYRRAVKPLLFRKDPEDVHDRTLMLAMRTGNSRILCSIASSAFCYRSKMLQQEVLGIAFENPVGLSAGFDKNAQLTDFMPALGFGFTEVGSITGEPCAGNDRPRLKRLPASKSILVYYGLKNDGSEAIAARLSGKKFKLPVGINVAKTNNQATCEDVAGIADYKKALAAFDGIGDYDTINISCPNTFGGQPFHDAGRLDALLREIDTVKTKKPRFLKISPDLSHQEVDAIIETVARHRIDGFICSNLTKNRQNEHIKDTDIPAYGGLSGKVVRELSDDLIGYVYRKTGGKYIIIGVGGIFSAEDAYRKICRGATLVELITGMIYQGPQLIGEINRGLVRLLKKDGYSNISEAVGSYWHKHSG